MNSYEAIATRQVNGFNKLVDALVVAGNLNEDVAVKVANLYLDEKIAKLDIGVGSFKIKHGAFFDVDVIERAVEMAA